MRAPTLHIGLSLALGASLLLASCSSSEEPGPVLTVNPSAVTLRVVDGAPATGTGITVRNAGGGSLSYSARTSDPWIQLASGSGTLAAGAVATVTVTPVTTSLTPGAYQGTVTIDAPEGGNAQTVAVQLTVDPAPARLQVPTTTVAVTAPAGGTATTGSVLVQNAGGVALQYTASATVPWLTVAPAAGSVTGGGSATITVTCNPAGLTAGTYAGVVVIAAAGVNGSPVNVPVSFVVTPPPAALTVTPAALTSTVTQGNSPANQSVQITNTGGQPLTWTASESLSWLTVSPGSGTLAPGATGSITVSYATASLTAGSYSGAVTISSAEASSGVQSVGVSLTVTAPAGSIAVSPSSLALSASTGTSPANRTITVTNTGGQSLTWTAAESLTWLSVSPASGTLAPGASAILTMAFTTSTLAAGGYNGTISVSAPGASNSPQNIDVALTMIAAPAPASITASVSSTSFTYLNLNRTATAVVRDQNGQVMNPQPALSWNSSAVNVASVSGSGVITANGPGSATITVQVAGTAISATLVVTVTQTASSIQVSPSTVSLRPIESATFTATVRDAGGTALVTQPVIAWSSSGSAIFIESASVNGSGYVVNAGAVGSGFITATAGSLVNSASMTVSVPAECTPTAVDLGSHGEYTANLTTASCRQDQTFGPASSTRYSRPFSAPIDGANPLYHVMVPSRTNVSPTQPSVFPMSATLTPEPGSCCIVNNVAEGNASSPTAITKWFSASTANAGVTGNFNFYLGKVPRDPTSSQPCQPLYAISLGEYLEGGQRQYTRTFDSGNACLWNSERAEVIAVFSERGTTFGNIIFNITWTGRSPRLSLYNAAGSLVASCRPAFNTANSCSMIDLSSGGSNNISVSTGLFFVVVRTGDGSASGAWTLSW